MKRKDLSNRAVVRILGSPDHSAQNRKEPGERIIDKFSTRMAIVLHKSAMHIRGGYFVAEFPVTNPTACPRKAVAIVCKLFPGSPLQGSDKLVHSGINVGIKYTIPRHKTLRHM